MWDEIKHERGADIAQLLQDPDRASKFSVNADGMLFDYAKTSITEVAKSALLSLAIARDVPGRRDAMFAGEKINETEGRAVLHTALRAGANA